jgi:prevent-host-death family protein
MESSESVSVTAGDISRNFGLWQDRALHAPVVVTHHGRPRVVVVSAELFQNLKPGTAGGHALSRAEIGLKAVLNAISEAFIAFDDQLQVAAVNTAFEALAGVNDAQLLGRDWTEIFPATRQAMIGEQLRRCLRTGEVVEFEAPAAPTGDRRCTLRAFPYPAGVAMTIVNRSEERDLRRRLGECLSFKAAFSGLHEVASVRLNIRGVIVALDEHFETLSGFSSEALLGCRLPDIFRPADRRHLAARIEHVLQTSEREVLTLTMLAKSGSEKVVELSLATVLDEGAPQGLVAAAHVVDTETDAPGDPAPSALGRS